MKKLAMIAALLFLLISTTALADTLTLPASLTRIEAEAFMNDNSLDVVELPKGVKYIGKKAFANSSVHAVILPSTLTFIAADAFDGCKDLEIDAPKGSYAYAWAQQNGYLDETPTTADDVVITYPETIQAGANLTITVEGGNDTMQHSVILNNITTGDSLSASITSNQGSITWQGYEFEPGQYKLVVYSIKNDFEIVKPDYKYLTVEGEKPAAPFVYIPDDNDGVLEFELIEAEHMRVREKIFVTVQSSHPSTSARAVPLQRERQAAKEEMP